MVVWMNWKKEKKQGASKSICYMANINIVNKNLLNEKGSPISIKITFFFNFGVLLFTFGYSCKMKK